MNVNTINLQKALKKKVFGQDELVETLSSVALIHELNQENKVTNAPAINNKTLLIGASGCGKTHAVKELAKLLNVNFIAVDGSKLQGNGYGGFSHSYDFLNEAINDYGKEGVENSIIFIDEFDKTLDVYSYQRFGSRIIQRDLLKLFDNDTFETNSIINGRRVVLDTSYMTIICAGSFVESLTAREKMDGVIHSNKIGFNVKKDNDNKNRKIINEQDLIDAGHLPELVGRFSRIVNLNLLSEKDVYNILKHGDNQLNSFIDYFKRKGVSLIPTDNYYKYLTKMVDLENFGFRGINKIITKDIDSILASSANLNAPNIRLDANNEKVFIEFMNKNYTTIHVIKRPIEKKAIIVQPSTSKHIYQDAELD